MKDPRSVTRPRSPLSTLGLSLVVAGAALSGCLDPDAEAPLDEPAAPADDAHQTHADKTPVPSTLPLAQPTDASRHEIGDCGVNERCRGTALEAGPGALNLVRNGRRGRGANSQLAVPRNLTFADINADGITDFVQTSQNRLFASKTDFAKTGILHLYQRRPIKRVLTGDFHGDGYDQTCLIQDDNALVCFGISTDRSELWWWFTQGSFVGDNEDFIVGDYTGDGRDDVLVYPRAGGAWRMYSLTGDYFFGATSAFAAGNLGTATAGLQVRAGDFNADGRDDVAVINGSGQIIYYASVYASSQNTFWWAFTTGGMVGSNDQVTVARIDDDNDDDVVLHDRVTGSTRFFRMEYAGASLPALTTVSTGQISTTGNSLLFWAAMHPVSAEPGASRRDDAMVYELGWNGFVRSDARWSGSQYTYWWAYTQSAPDNHAGWAALASKPWLFLKCKFSDIATTPAVDSFYQNLVFGTWGLGHYWLDNSYGAWDAYTSTVRDTWYPMSVTNAYWTNNLSRWDRVGACINAYGGSTSGYVNTIGLVNGEGDAGNAGGRVLMTPNSSNSTFLAHETGHTFGYWDHSFDDTSRRAADWSAPGEYFDNWDIMSAMNVFAFSTANGAAGPGINTPYLNKMSFIPAHRKLQLTPTSSSQSARINVAALNRPEAAGPLYVRIGSNDADHFTVEYRMKSGWDQAIPRATVLVHRVVNGVSYLQTTYGGAERLPGTTAWYWTGSKWISVTVNSFATEGFTADVSIGY